MLELVFSLYDCLVPCLAIVIVYFSIRYYSKSQKRSPPANGSISNGTFPLPPGGRGWPVIGESLEYFTDLKNGVPENFVTKRFGKYSSKIFKTSIMGEQMALLRGAEGNKFLFSSEGKMVKNWVPEFLDKIFGFSNRQDFYDSGALLSKISRNDFKADYLHIYLPILDSVMKQQLKTNWNVRQLKVSEVVSRYTSTYACLIFLSIDDVHEVEMLRKKMKDIIAGSMSMAIDFPGTDFHKAIRASKIVRKQFEEMIKQRNVDGSLEKNDLLSHLLLANHDKLSDTNISSAILGLMHASTSPIDSTITSMMMYLAERSDVYHEVLQEQVEITRSKDPKRGLNWGHLGKMRYSWNVVKEVLRLRPPTVGTFREAITDITYDGHTIPKGWKFHWMAYATHKSPDYFENPEEFNPARFEGTGPPPYSFVPFGGGPSMCPGNEFSRIVILVFIHYVVTTFRWEKVIPNEKIVTDPVPRPAQGLPVLLHPHKP